ncbi:YTH domain [Dillenia turbinata]|uniref:YTH domain-containing family protein n=1 Tax=Dillenia turbinata TaxID=194707 RepID=A0AAN8W754_9MAGN
MAAELHPRDTSPFDGVIKKNIKIDPPAKHPISNMVPLRDASASDATSCISSSGDPVGSTKGSEGEAETRGADLGAINPTSTSYYGYYYPGYNGSFVEMDDQGYLVGGDGWELQYPVMQADNGSLFYLMPGYQAGYNPYGPYLPMSPVGDTQLVSQQPYPLSPVFPTPVGSPGYFPNPSYGSELIPSSYLWNPSLVGDGANRNNYHVVSESPGSKASLSASNNSRIPPSKSFPQSDYSSLLDIKGSSLALDFSLTHGAPNQLKPVKKVLLQGTSFQQDPVFANGYFPMGNFPSYHSIKSGLFYPNGPDNFKGNGQAWGGNEKPRTWSKTMGAGDFQLLSEQNQGPRTAKTNEISTDGKGNSNSINTVIRRDQYNLADFSTKYDDALFFVIKSYSEDDIHKSIKHNVWASTSNGNKRLDGAYKDAQERIAEKGIHCPVFLFFSVNASGQFCGVAEMIGRVDFSKNMDFWQQDKWNGFFPVKWHIIKDVPNPQLRHILLENNDDKPVTNSRDTQEVRFPQGTEMLNIFKNYVSKTSILDDFDFYESRQKVLQDKKFPPMTRHFGHLKKVDDITAHIQSVDLSASKDFDGPQVLDKGKE